MAHTHTPACETDPDATHPDLAAAVWTILETAHADGTLLALMADLTRDVRADGYEAGLAEGLAIADLITGGAVDDTRRTR